jgi:hypothetical protein
MDDTPKLRFYRATTKFVCAGYEVDDRGIIVHSAPFFRKFIGKKKERLEAWIKLYDGTIEEIPERGSLVT